MPTTAVMAPAVLRMSVPMPSESSPRTARYKPVPTTVRSAPGAPMPTPMPLADRIAWPMKKAVKQAVVVTARVTAANTVALAARTVRRWGTAANVVRIMPLPYSLVMTRTPSTAMASCARIPPVRLNDAGVEAGLVLGAEVGVLRHVDGAHDRRQPDRGAGGGEQRPVGRPDAADLGPLRGQDVGADAARWASCARLHAWSVSR